MFWIQSMFRGKKTEKVKSQDSVENLQHFHFKRTRPVKRGTLREAKKESKFPIIVSSIAIVVCIIASMAIVVFVVSMYFPKKNNSSIILPFTAVDEAAVLRKDLSAVGLAAMSIETASGDGTLIVQIKEGPKVYFSPQEDIKSQVSSLQLIISRLTIEKRNPTLVDFRYNRPIVKF